MFSVGYLQQIYTGRHVTDRHITFQTSGNPDRADQCTGQRIQADNRITGWNRREADRKPAAGNLRTPFSSGLRRTFHTASLRHDLRPDYGKSGGIKQIARLQRRDFGTARRQR